MAGLPRTFFISPLGDDSHSGLSRAQAWKTPEKVNAVELKDGDQVLLEGGKVFQGSLRLHAKLGSEDRPIVIGSFNRKRATIECDGPAIEASSSRLVIRDLILKGNATDRKEGAEGISLHSSERMVNDVRLENVDVSGFGGSGIVVAADGVHEAGFGNLVISHCRCKNNFGNGIEVTGKNGPRYPHSNVLIEGCECSGNRSGSGIVVAGVRSGLIERCSAFDNAGPGGGVGIWAWRCEDVVFKECIAARTRSKNGDGGGFDLDGGCVNCRIERCLSYENDGPGYMHCDYPSAPPTHGNVIADCLSINDGRKPKGDNVGFGFVTWGSGLDDCRIAGNVAIVTEKPSVSAKPIFFVTYVEGAKADSDVLHVKGCSFENNRAYILAKSYLPMDVEGSAPSTEVSVSGNRYWVPEDEAGIQLAGGEFLKLDGAAVGRLRQVASEASRTRPEGILKLLDQLQALLGSESSRRQSL